MVEIKIFLFFSRFYELKNVSKKTELTYRRFELKTFSKKKIRVIE